jgi:hypothetical protein
VGMQPETLCVSHRWSSAGFITTQSVGTMQIRSQKTCFLMPYKQRMPECKPRFVLQVKEVSTLNCGQ